MDESTKAYYDLINAQQQANNEWSAQQVQKAMDYQTEMSNTAHQREVKDLIAAGLNPVLSAGGSGATTGSGIAASAGDGNVTALYGLAKQAIDANMKQAEAMANQAKSVADASSGKGSGSGSGSGNGSGKGSGSGSGSERDRPGGFLGTLEDIIAQFLKRKYGIDPETTYQVFDYAGEGLESFEHVGSDFLAPATIGVAEYLLKDFHAPDPNRAKDNAQEHKNSEHWWIPSSGIEGAKSSSALKAKNVQEKAKEVLNQLFSASKNSSKTSYSRGYSNPRFRPSQTKK